MIHLQVALLSYSYTYILTYSIGEGGKGGVNCGDLVPHLVHLIVDYLYTRMILTLCPYVYDPYHTLRLWLVSFAFPFDI
jgi:hypothetical protein